MVAHSTSTATKTKLTIIYTSNLYNIKYAFKDHPLSCIGNFSLGCSVSNYAYLHLWPQYNHLPVQSSTIHRKPDALARYSRRSEISLRDYKLPHR